MEQKITVINFLEQQRRHQPQPVPPPLQQRKVLTLTFKHFLKPAK